MTLLVRAAELHGRPVVTIDTAEDVAEVKDVVFSHETAEVVGFTLNKRGFLGSPLKEVLPWSRVVALGPDAVMVETWAAIGRDDEAMGEVAAKGQPDVIGTRVVTDGGKELGHVTDVIVQVGARADLVGYEIGGEPVKAARKDGRLLIPIGDTVALSGDALVVPAVVEEFVHDDLSGFGSAVEEYRQRLRQQA
jgi:uncharacterized protein YrrD